MQELSKAEKLLVAAGQLAREGRSEFSAEDLVVAAFLAYPNDFSLKGHPKYPDSNAILTQLMGKDARLIVKGWLEKTGTKTYRLTAKGLHDVSSLTDESGVAGNIHLDRPTEEALGRLLTAPAYEMFRDGRSDAVTFHQFCRFIGLAAADKWQKVQGKLNNARHLVELAVRLGESGQGLRLHFRGKNDTYSPDDLRLLRAVHDSLVERFKPQMDEWRRNVLE